MLFLAKKMRHKMKKTLFLLLFLSFSVWAAEFPPATHYEVCFTPGGDCTGKIVSAINEAKSSILVQAYSFTSAPIIRALIAAHKRGVDVKIILDKSDFRGHTAKTTAIVAESGIPIWKDYKPHIAHNKVIVIDGDEIITGSFNFSKAAQLHNAENLLIIRDKGLAEKYAENWERREEASERLANVH
jgi:phosphatidylserine/phosphatidylglycerophosphate/cardiolipin synthase-like enzyme